MRPVFLVMLLLACFTALFLCCYAPALFKDRQFGFRDAGHYYYPLHARVQKEWNERRWPLWEPEENSGMPLLGNPTAAVLYPGKIVFNVLPYKWAARIYIVAHSLVAFTAMLDSHEILENRLGRGGRQCPQLYLWCTDPVSVLQYHLPGRRRVASAGSSCRRPLGPAGPALGYPGTGPCPGTSGSRWRPAVGLPARDRWARLCAGAYQSTPAQHPNEPRPMRDQLHRNAAVELCGWRQSPSRSSRRGSPQP